MGIIKINRKNTNLELISKLMNSVAVKYNCSVHYNTENNLLNFSGDDTCKSFIAEDTMRLFAKGL